MITVKKENIDDFLGWNKILIGVNSASLMSLLFKFSDVTKLDNGYKIATVLFFLSLFFLLLCYAGFIEHKNATSDKLGKITSIVFMLGWFFLILGYSAITYKIVSL